MRHAARLYVIFASILVLSACGGGGEGEGAGAGHRSAQGWSPASPLPGACCNYASLVFTGKGDGVRIYTNAGIGGDGLLHLYAGSLGEGLAPRGPVLKVSEPSEAYIRTSAIVRRGEHYYALLFTGTGYPPTDGYAPSWAESEDGVSWIFKGSVNPFKTRPFSSSMAMTVDDAGKFRAWTDGAGSSLREMSSPNGLVWTDDGDVWPKSLPIGQVVFPSATRTAKGTMLAVADAWPAQKIRVLWQCHGQKEFAVLEEDSPIHNGPKGTTLAWDGTLIHAYVRDSHWTHVEPACPAP